MSPRPWILIRGWTREVAHWDRFPELLRARHPGARVLALDLPGTGARRSEESPLTIAGITEAIREEARRELGPLEASRPRLVTLSMGSMVGVDWACRHPGEVGGLVLINPSFRGLSPWHQRLVWLRIPDVLRAIRAGDPEASERIVVDMILSRADKKDEMVRSWSRLRRERPIRRGTTLRQLLAAFRYAAPERLPEGVPALLVNSLSDRLVDPRCSAAAQAHWGIPMRRHPTAGHDLPVDEPEWLLEQLEDWVRAEGPAATG